MSSSGLSALFGDAANGFLHDDWPARHRFVAGADDRLRDLVALVADLAPEALVTIPHELRRVSMRTLERPAALVTLYQPSEEDTISLVRAGGILVLQSVRHEVIAAQCRALEHDLGLPPGWVHVNLWCSRRGGAAVLTHFDAQDNFMLQLRGRKRWRIAPNRHVMYPSQNGSVGERHPEAADGLPPAMPADAETFELTPGAVLFVPSGTWHDTETTDELSIHLTFIVRNPTKLDLVRFLVDQLPAFKSVAWRAPLVRPVVDGAIREGVVDDAIAELRKVLEGLEGFRMPVDESLASAFFSR